MKKTTIVVISKHKLWCNRLTIIHISSDPLSQFKVTFDYTTKSLQLGCDFLLYITIYNMYRENGVLVYCREKKTGKMLSSGYKILSATAYIHQ